MLRDILELEKRTVVSNSLNKKLSNFNNLIRELNKREIDLSTVERINIEVSKLNSFVGSESDLLKVLLKSRSKILKLVEDNLGLYVKGHNKRKMVSVGLGLGVSLGVAIGVGSKNMGLMTLGIPIGYGIGMAMGKRKDDEVYKQGKQLNVEIEM